MARGSDFERGRYAACFARFIMLKILGRHAVPLARASCSGAAVPGVRVFAVVLAASAWVPGVQATEAAIPEAADFRLFKHYQGWREEPLQDWREANERVGEIGGWRVYLRESQPASAGADSGPAHPRHHGH
jgi:hypothetical protein